MLFTAGVTATALAQGQFPWGTVDPGRQDAYALGMWGDLPYSDLQALVGVPNLIADMNSQNLAFTAHNGDLKAGSGTPGSVTPTTCSDALSEQALERAYPKLIYYKKHDRGGHFAAWEQPKLLTEDLRVGLRSLRT
jgi:hypothetical protein